MADRSFWWIIVATLLLTSYGRYAALQIALQ
jgi:hypothetical protein